MKTRRYQSGSVLYVIELKHPKAWRLACGINDEATSFFSLTEARTYRRMVEGRGIDCRIVRYSASNIVGYRRKWERRAMRKKRLRK